MFYKLSPTGLPARTLRKIGAIDFATTIAPGIRDVLLTGKVKEAVARTDRDGNNAYDAVVLDGPPTGRIGKFLDATKEVASLARIGPINRQSEGVIALLHSAQTAVHLVTLLEEMPVQETLDAAGELTAAGFRVGAVLVNRARPTLIADGADGDGTVDVVALTKGLAHADIPAEHVTALAAEMLDYAERQRIQAENSLRLDSLDVPRIELPDLNPPVGLGELNELAAQLAEQDAR
jgi:anion-transporting  ArsA/GET3 family ATPase